MEEKIIALVEALKPLMDALDVNESDTLSSMNSDRTVVWSTSGSWGPDAQVTLGDIRKIREALAAPAPPDPQPVVC